MSLTECDTYCRLFLEQRQRGASFQGANEQFLPWINDCRAREARTKDGVVGRSLW